MAITHYVSIKFTTSQRPYFFGTEIGSLKIGDKVVAESIKGLQLGEVVGLPIPINKYKSDLLLKPLLRIANENDLLLFNANQKRALETVKIATIEINKLNLDMKVLDAEYALDGAKVTITYVSEDRVDFRELLRILAAKFHTRIELRQIGSRDKAKIIGGIGLCGLPLCCSTFIKTFDIISINRAKNQLLALNIPKLSGHCGKLICCLMYEDDNYTELKKEFPSFNDTFIKDDKKFKIIGMNLFSKIIKAECEGDIEFFKLDEIKPLLKHKKKYEKSKL